MTAALPHDLERIVRAVMRDMKASGDFKTPGEKIVVLMVHAAYYGAMAEVDMRTLEDAAAAVIRLTYAEAEGRR